MCGIAGFMLTDRAAPPASVLDTFERALSHRGPDGVKRHVEHGLGLVHTRLAIIDLKTGDQPLYGPNGAVLIANGEIYNYIELKRNFPQQKFATSSDCELPLMTYAQEGADFAKPLRGMYAIALADPRALKRSISRAIPSASSRSTTPRCAGGLLFASEPRSDPENGPRGAHRFAQGRDRAARSCNSLPGERTIFPGIKRGRARRNADAPRSGRVAGRQRIAALPACTAALTR